MVKAIETTYAGCRFRSRLEARWAVFFDALGVVWEYEPEGVEVSYRLSLREGTFAYLPDFWLPEYELWAEVKASWTEDECLRFLDAAAYLGGACGTGSDVLVLGPFVGGRYNWPTLLHMHKGNLSMERWRMMKPVWCEDGLVRRCQSRNAEIIAGDYGGTFDSVVCGTGHHGDVPTELLRGYELGRLNPFEGRERSAISAARSARFEHGQSGAVA